MNPTDIGPWEEDLPKTKEGAAWNGKLPEGTAANIHALLAGMVFPAEKDELIQQANTRPITHSAQEVLNKLPKRSYHNIAEVMAAVEKENL